MVEMMLVVFVPHKSLDLVKDALFRVGAGEVGNYKHCAWETRGLGQFIPKKDALPHIGSMEQKSCVEEMRLEIPCPKALIGLIKETLYTCHPYEEPVFYFVNMDLL